jgi:phage FluMu protein gp41
VHARGTTSLNENPGDVGKNCCHHHGYKLQNTTTGTAMLPKGLLLRTVSRPGTVPSPTSLRQVRSLSSQGIFVLEKLRSALEEYRRVQ